jgi:hypothetical protein
MQFIKRAVSVAPTALPLVNLPPHARELVLQPVNVPKQPVDLELQREARGGVRLARTLRLGLEGLQRGLHGVKVSLALGEQGLRPGKVGEGALEGGVLGLQGAVGAAQLGVVVFVGDVEIRFGVLAGLAFALDLVDEIFDVLGELFLAGAVGVNFLAACFVHVCCLLELRF